MVVFWLKKEKMNDFFSSGQWKWRTMQRSGNRNSLNGHLCIHSLSKSSIALFLIALKFLTPFFHTLISGTFFGHFHLKIENCLRETHKIDMSDDNGSLCRNVNGNYNPMRMSKCANTFQCVCYKYAFNFSAIFVFYSNQ